MALIYYYPNPVSTPAATNYNYSNGDYYINQNGAIFKATPGSGLSAGKIIWPKPTGIVPPTSLPTITASTLVPSSSALTGQVLNVTIASAWGGTAIIPTGGTTNASRGTSPCYTVSVSPSLPAGLTLSTTSVGLVTRTNPDTTQNLYNAADLLLSGTPTASIAQTTFTVTFTDQAGNSGSTNFTLTVASGSSPLSTTQSVATKVLTQGIVATAFTPVTATGGDGTKVFSISPSLPTGLSFNSLTGQITGTPSAAIIATEYIVTVTDATGDTSSKSFTLTVEAPAVSTVLSLGSYSFVNTVAFAAFKPVSGSGGIGSLTYTISPSLPSGMTIDSVTGNISGPATAVSPLTSYTVTVTDSNSPAQSSSKSFTIAVAELPALTSTLLISSSTLTKNSQSYSFIPVSGSGGYGTLTYAISPSLSAGLSFNTSTGRVSGNPSALSSLVTYTVSIADQAGQSTSKQFSIEVVPGALLTTQVVSNKVGIRNVAVTSFTPVTASGGDGALTYSVSPSLPSGLNLNTSSGAIAGTPTESSTATVYTITVTDTATQSSSKTFTLTVEAPPLLTTQAIPSKTLIQYDPVSAFIPVLGSGGYGALSYTIAPSLPTGLSFSSGTGQVAGTPTQYLVTATTFAVTVRDAALQVSTSTFALTVETKPLVVQTSVGTKTYTRSAPSTPYTPVTVIGGSESYTFSIDTSLPSGLSFNTATGQISGTATSTSTTATYSVTVTDSLAVQGTSTFNLNVVNPPALTTVLAVTSSTFYRLIDSVSVSPVTAAGGYGSIAFAINPTLPSGLSFSTSNGRISGIATQFVDQTYTITASDSLGQTSSKEYSLTITYSPLTTTQVVISSTLTRGKPITAFIPVTSAGGSGLTTFSISPSLPAGLTFNVSTGQIAGTPSETLTATTFTVTASDSVGNTSNKTFTLTVNLPAALLTTSTVESVTLTVGISVSPFTPVTASGGDGQITFTVAPTLPLGLLFDTNTAAIRGTPAAISSTATYSITAADSVSQRSTGTFALNVLPRPIVVTVNNSTLIFTKYSAVTPSIPVSATGDQITYSLSEPLPAGLTFNTSTGEITGTPTEVSDDQLYVVTATDAYANSNTGSFNLTVNDFVPEELIVTPVNNTVTLDVNTPAELFPVNVSGGFGNFTYSISPSTLPDGLLFNTETGEITGTPTVLATSQEFTVSVTDGVPQTSSGAFLLSVIVPVVTQGKGYTGSRGYTGSAGFTGSRGYTGSAGFTGSAGEQGDQGTQGYTGSRGAYDAIGFTGSAGSSGADGFTGSSGDTGFTGSAGNDGYTGSSGDTGFTGSAGNDGSQGDTGFTGSKGADGTSVQIVGSTSTFSTLPTEYAGSIGDGYITLDNGHLNIWTGSEWSDVGTIVGPQGNAGFTGSAGYSGSRGDAGFVGSQGDIGYTGSQGEAGFTGSAGQDGIIGYNGSDGYTGSQGELGYTGSSGDTGFTGSQGDVGYTGSSGDTGFTGSQGDVGYTGSQGDVGYTGSSGDTGFTGSQGDLGYTGSSGDIGFTGSAGQDGIVGYDGSVGFTGSQGELGYTGSSGDIGFTGSQGIPGEAAAIGYTGSKGDPGDGAINIEILGVATSSTVSTINFSTGTTVVLVGNTLTVTAQGSGIIAGANYDGGRPGSNYGGITSLNAGGVT